MKIEEISISINELAKTFISNSPDFYADLSINDIDSKHQKIVESAYREFGGDNNSWDNFRNWVGQSDGLAPMNFTVEVLHNRRFAKNFIKYFYKKIFRYQTEKFFLQSINDDFEVIKAIGAESILRENRISETPGFGSYYEISSGCQLNQRWARYIYLLGRILNEKMLNNDGIWVDIGPFYGGLQGLARKYFPQSKMILIDFHHQLCRSYIYLANLYPNSNHIFPNQIGDSIDFKNLPKNSFVYLPVSYFDKVAHNLEVDLISNFFSFGEMRRSHYRKYVDSPLIENAKKHYLVNRVVSAPFFEKTYDSDLNVIDYISLGRHIDYFDIFPMHHYQILNREVFGREGYRNTGSSYFELISSI